MSRQEKAKSGFLDTFFSRPYKKGQKNYGSTGEFQTDQNSDITLKVSTMGVDEINSRFLEILEDMNIPKDKREPLMMKDTQEKRAMILMHFKGEAGGIFLLLLVCSLLLISTIFLCVACLFPKPVFP